MKIIFRLGVIMEKRDNYNTKQKEIILDLIEGKDKEFTVKDIYLELKGKIGLTTIYRLVDKLVEEGSLNKKDNYYQYLEHCDCENHFYLKCTNCGCLIHVDCDCISELVEHIFKEHNFKPDKEKIIINGLCKDCLGK